MTNRSPSPETTSEALSELSSGDSDTGDTSTTFDNNSQHPSTIPLWYKKETLTYYPLAGIRPIEPTYLSIADQEPALLDMGPFPRKLVVLDLNGTLFYRSFHRNRKTIHQRPFLRTFLNFLFQRFRVMVWSSARQSSVDAMLEAGFADLRTNLDRVWSREHFGMAASEYNRKVLTLKDLSRVWMEIEDERKNAAESEMRPGGRYATRYDQTNTILIDDSVDKSQLQPQNCIVVTSFNRAQWDLGKDEELIKVMAYMKQLIPQQNVSAYMKKHPFNSESNEFDEFLKKYRKKKEKVSLKRAHKKAKKRELRQTYEDEHTKKIENILDDVAPTEDSKSSLSKEVSIPVLPASTGAESNPPSPQPELQSKHQLAKISGKRSRSGSGDNRQKLNKQHKNM
ncbi:hypothetical protein BX616_004009 [Lobosporangium transversale]|uniref:Mitochondrial import inner membrane translocase subunit TIM50 n=1 Tax=Lobosporangium transversale TaxID=64571 RepID=A0A1Y2GU17_9FUNG|nr:HAD-like domain-containing protein [Lobosporangium transversale]KAF9898451.1 hypothetical protein BX616_004009 [Lobosporangium transversale]ORZ20844.1 HAD-like domain-containing protein [Lobosporangium transversale]|eukprot:XP_021882753.1 HAD-like domain-containing protein [Lobosporangium transversale]